MVTPSRRSSAWPTPSPTCCGRTPSGVRRGCGDGQYAVDLDADRACLDRLLSAGFSVLSEESGRQGPSDRPVVVVDPLDGSTNASRGVPWFGTALCLVDDDGPAVALRGEPRHGRAVHGDPRSRRRTRRRGDLGVGVRGARRCARRSERAARPPLRLGAVPRARCLGARHLRRRQRRARRVVRHEPRRARCVGLPRVASSSSRRPAAWRPRSAGAISSCSTMPRVAHRRSRRRPTLLDAVLAERRRR